MSLLQQLAALVLMSPGHDLPPVAVQFKPNNRRIYRQLVGSMLTGTGSPAGQDFAIGLSKQLKLLRCLCA